MSCYVVLCCVMSCYVQRYVVLCRVMYSAMSCYVRRYVVLCRIMYGAMLCYVVLCKVYACHIHCVFRYVTLHPVISCYVLFLCRLLSCYFNSRKLSAYTHFSSQKMSFETTFFQYQKLTWQNQANIGRRKI